MKIRYWELITRHIDIEVDVDESQKEESDYYYVLCEEAEEEAYTRDLKDWKSECHENGVTPL
jgi:hypothetical protein